MVTRRTLLKQGVYATLSAATASIVTRVASAQDASPASFDFYISPTGSDSNPGTLDQPWAITAINTRRGDYAGKRVGLLDGTYNVHALCQAAPSWSSTALAVNGGSGSTSPTIIAAVNARQAILTGADPSTGAYPTVEAGIIGQGFLQVANKGNVILDGLYITRGRNAGVLFYPMQGLNPEGGVTGIVVRNCEVYDIGGVENNNPGAIKLHFVTGALISNNKIHSVQPSLGQDAAGIFSFNSRSNVYEYNTIYDCNSGIYDKNSHTGNHTHRYNYLEIAGTYPAQAMTDCSGGDAGDVITVHNNVFVAPGTWNGSDPVLPSKQSLVFYNNTCYCRSAEGGIFYPAGGSQISPPAMVTFYNNIIYSPAPTTGYAGAVRFCSGALALSNYNLYRIGSASSAIFGLSPVSAPRAIPTLYTLSAWQKATGLDGNSVTSDYALSSLFVAANSLDPISYALQPSATGRNLGRVGGTASGAPTDVGAWGGGATRIGCDFGPVPRSPVLNVTS
jgi:Right handed beta helix region